MLKQIRLKNKKPIIVNLSATATLNVKINEVKNKIPIITLLLPLLLLLLKTKYQTIVNISLLRKLIN